MNPLSSSILHRRLGLVLGLACWLAALLPAMAQTIVTSVTPSSGALGVPINTHLVFTFSAPMNTDPGITSVMLIDISNPLSPITITPVWNAPLNTILTCTPAGPLPIGKMLYWVLSGETADGTPIPELETFGSFTTGTGGGPVDTNLLSSFTAAKGFIYLQTSPGPAELQTNFPFAFVACTTLASTNTNVTNVVVTFPNGTQTNLPGTSIPLHLSYTGVSSNLTSFEGTYPNGVYTYDVQAPGSSTHYTVNLPATLTQPAAPHITNFLAAQAIDASKPFTLGWDAFPGGTAADCITVEIYGGVFSTPALGQANALDGTAKNVVIPAGTFQPNHNYQGAIGFYHYTLVTNSALALAYRSSVTEFSLSTYTSITPIVLTNQMKAGSAFTFDVLSGADQALVVEGSSNLLSGSWQTLFSTNSPGRFPYTDPRPATNRSFFYRIRTGQ